MTFSNTNERQSRPHPMIGAQLGQYKIVDMVGGGGMGVVFRARQEMIDRYVALKLLPPELAHDEINSKRLEREAKALAKLNHPHIVTTFDFGLTEYGQAYLVMELVDGESLKEILLRDTRFELSRAVKIFIQLADAMRFAHSFGIVHRDLKPHNVMLAQVPSPDFVKVLDFGIASLADSQKLTRVGEIIGSPLYMSPEQCLSDPVDERTDIYAFGVLMYLMLAGQVPFKGETLYETVEKKCTQPIPRFADIAPHAEIPSFLEELIRHCLAVEPKDRFQTMEEIKDLLESLPIAKKKSEPMEATSVLGGPSAAPARSALPTKSIKEKMQDNTNNQKAVQASAPSAQSRQSSAGAGRTSPSRPSRIRPIDEKKGIVLTPGVLMVGILILLICMAAGVVVGVSTVYNGTFLPVSGNKAGSAGGAKQTETTAKSTEPKNTQESTTSSGVPQSESGQKNAGSTPQTSGTKPSSSHETQNSGSNDDTATKPQAGTTDQSVQTKQIPPQHKPASHLKTQAKKPPKTKPTRKHSDVSSQAPDRPSQLPTVRHTLPGRTDADRWFDFNK